MKKQPGEIEQASFAIIREELRRRGLVPDEKNAAVVLRCIHASVARSHMATCSNRLNSRASLPLKYLRTKIAMAL